MKSTDLSEILKFEQTPFWIISTKAQKAAGVARMFQNIPEDDNVTDNLELSLDKLDKVVQWLPQGKYIIKYFKDEKNKSRGFFEQEFVHGEVSSSNRIAGDPSGIPGSIGAIERMVEEKVDARMKAKKLEELEKENEELKKAVQDPAGWKSAIGNVLTSINDQAPQLLPVMASEILSMIKGIFGKSALAGPAIQPPVMPNYRSEQQTINKTDNSMDNQNINSDEKLQQIENELTERNEDYAQVIFRLRMLDPDLLETLQKMATKAEANPAMITMLKTML